MKAAQRSDPSIANLLHYVTHFALLAVDGPAETQSWHMARNASFIWILWAI